MAILHGSWQPSDQGGYFFLWGETWRSLSAPAIAPESGILVHPLAMTHGELAAWLRGGARDGVSLPPELWKGDRLTSAVQEIQVVALPTDWSDGAPVTALPRLSGAAPGPDSPALGDGRSLLLHPWQVPGIRLSAAQTWAFLQSLPLGLVNGHMSLLGDDLRYWSHGARWCLDILARSKFVPRLLPTESAYQARWQPLLDSAVDQARLEHFVRHMPPASRCYGPDGAEKGAPAVFLAEPRPLLQHFLAALLDAQVRSLAPAQTDRGVPETVVPMGAWLAALGQPTVQVEASAEAIAPLESALATWMAPIQHHLAGHQAFQACFQLHAPTEASDRWLLTYGLQAVNDPDFRVEAEEIWNHPVETLIERGRAIAQPQETLLRGLGLASRLFVPLEASLDQPHPSHCVLSPLEAYDFIKTASFRLQDSGFGVVLPPSLTNRNGFANRLGLKIQAQTPDPQANGRLGLQSLLNLAWELSIGGQTLSKREFDRLVALKTPLVEINGEWVELRDSDIRAAQEFFANRKDKATLSLEDALRISTGDSQTIGRLPVVSFEATGALQELVTTLTGRRSLETATTPAGFQGQLRPYQARGVGWLAFLERWNLGACLADDMGLGKTIELIAFLLHLQERGDLQGPTLLVCPTSVLGNWEREVQRFGPSLKAWVHHGDKRLKAKAFAKEAARHQLVITSYALIPRDLKTLQEVRWRGVVLDEAQNIKNADSKQSQAVRQLEAQFRIALTGTPVENRLAELWSILDFLNPNYLGPRKFFQRRFAVPIERYGDTDSLRTLRSLVQPFILRRLKTDREIIQDLPDKQEMTVFCGLSAEQASLYQHTVDQSLLEIDAAEGIQRRGIILALLTKLKQICNHPAHFLKHPQLSSTQRSGKLQRLEEMLEEVFSEGDRALIFTQFAEWGKLLQPYLETRLGQEALFLYGGVRKKQREEMVDRFQNDPQAPRVMILSLKAGGVGLNLTRANHVFHFDRWWNPAVENQATDRVFRIGQTRNVQVHKFVCSGTLEAKIHDMIEGKKALAEQVVGSGEDWLTELNTDQLRDLLLLDRSAVIDEEL
ncbi:DEAD/DEAH box helicase [Geitlerinema sp. PCC 7407]|uniref:DEAD/DEAH box helicase n=1 Tax=Geitlerinema sp. PCC 7407 TaxID=1173025 RepID=UPI00029FD71C|nr:DEAD/DEAH box helicase [Geitlerinema sp. PCC 7407]AFY64653.1 SNF2-related protein [Geitlerinema sp. PCC 7407]